MRRLLRLLSVPVVWAMVPIKRWAWTTRSRFLRGLLLEVTSAIDFTMVALHVQNGALMLNARAFGGNFLFGKTVMLVGHTEAARDIVAPQLRGSMFMGLPIVGYAPTAFMTNAGPINVSQPARGVLRAHMDAHVLRDAHRHPDASALRDRCAHVLEAWLRDPERDTLWAVRGTVTRILGIALADVDIPKPVADTTTAAYLRRFAELSAFAYYLPFMLGLLGTREGMRRSVFLPLRRLGIDTLVVDMILFAGMFSVGTIVIKCVELTREHDIDYGALTPGERLAFVLESFRIHPTVSTVHRIVEAPEVVRIGGRSITVQPGQEIAYPFVCINRDPEVFSDPNAFRIDRPAEETAEILSWSRGPHVCPVRDLSVVVTRLMLDALAEATGDLRKVRIFDIEV